jgi:hypothetical protein
MFSGTSIKIKGDSSFESLEPMKFADLMEGDVIRFGHKITAEFHDVPEEIVESSQPSGTYYSLEPSTSNNKQFFAPSTEKMDFANISTDSESINKSIEIPQTQEGTNVPVITIFNRSRLDSSGTSISSGTALEIISNVDEKSRDGFMISQDIFGEVSTNKSLIFHHNVDFDDDLDERVSMPGDGLAEHVDIDDREGSVTPDLVFVNDREGSITPDLDFPSEPQPKSRVSQADIATQLNFDDSEEMPAPPRRRLLEADIATQFNSDDSNEMSAPPRRRLLQADIATQLNTEDDFEESQLKKETTIQNNMEINEQMMQPTQPMFMFGSRTRLHTKRQAELKPKTISLSEFDDTQQINDGPPSAKKIKPSFMLETQPIDVRVPNNQKILKKPKATNRILLSSSDESEDEVMPSAIVPDAVASPESPKINAQKFTKFVVNSPKTPPRYTDSPLLSSDNDTPDLLPKLPSHSQLESFLENVNASQPFNESAVAFDPSLEDEEAFHNDKSSKQHHSRPVQQKKVRRNFMKYAHAHKSDDDEGPSTSAKVVQQMKAAKTAEAKESKPAEVSKPTKFPKIFKSEAEVSKTKTLRAPEKPMVEKKIYSIAITNIYDNAMKNKLESMCEKLGSTIVEHIIEADFLLTNDKMKLTAKFLASINKGIPIVSGDFIEASMKAKKWLDPYEWIIVDSEMEEKKEMSLKATILKAKSEKFLQNYSVFVTKNTMIPYSELKEIIESAGAECVESLRHEARNENVALIYNPKESAQIKSITKKYSNIAKIRDNHICVTVLRQALPNPD